MLVLLSCKNVKQCAWAEIWEQKTCVLWKHNPDAWLSAVLVTAKLPPKSSLTWDVRQDDCTDRLCVWTIWVGVTLDPWCEHLQATLFADKSLCSEHCSCSFCPVHSTKQAVLCFTLWSAVMSAAVAAQWNCSADQLPLCRQALLGAQCLAEFRKWSGKFMGETSTWG